MSTESAQHALAYARGLLEDAPQMALKAAESLLHSSEPDDLAWTIVSAVLRLAGDLRGAEQALSHLPSDWENSEYLLERGLVALALGDVGRGERDLLLAVSRSPHLASGWRALGDLYGTLGDHERSAHAYSQFVVQAANDSRLLEAGSALCSNDLPRAEQLLRQRLRVHPTDVVAMRMLAELAGRLGRYRDAQKLLARCLELAPGFSEARHNYALVLHRQGKTEDALREAEKLLAREPGNPNYLNMKAAVLGLSGDSETAAEIYSEVLAGHGRNPKVWLSYGHALKTAGRTTEAIVAYRKSAELAPSFGDAYWSLANLKTFRFTAPEIERMRRQLQDPKLTAEDRFHLHFALAKALEDQSDYSEAFEQYRQGNALRRSQLRYEADDNTRFVGKSLEFLTADFFEDRHGSGSPATDPIFIVGLPRAGSTLLEQILSSHSAIEGTGELPNLISIVGELGRSHPKESGHYLRRAAPTSEQLAALGERYLRESRIQRKTQRPHFIDKMPNNFAHVGLIHLMLPNSKIIDIRRHPMSAVFALFKQHFARGQPFAYDLIDIARYYKDYVTLMEHYERVLPGRVYRVFYERLVTNPADEIARLLSHLGLEYDSACLRFYENDRAVRTPSAEQVRRPLNRDGLERWRHFEQWLAPARDVLADLIASYPVASAT